MEVKGIFGRLHSEKYMELIVYRIQKENDKFVIYKSDKALLLPCKMLKKKRVEFDNESDAMNYIRYISHLIKSGKEYVEIYQ